MNELCHQLCELCPPGSIFLPSIQRSGYPDPRFLRACYLQPSGQYRIDSFAYAHSCGLTDCAPKTRAQGIHFGRRASSQHSRSTSHPVQPTRAVLRLAIPIRPHIHKLRRKGHSRTKSVYRQASRAQRALSVHHASRCPRVSKLSSQ